mgnify:CR=1 FL=1
MQLCPLCLRPHHHHRGTVHSSSKERFSNLVFLAPFLKGGLSINLVIIACQEKRLDSKSVAFSASKLLQACQFTLIAVALPRSICEPMHPFDIDETDDFSGAAHNSRSNKGTKSSFHSTHSHQLSWLAGIDDN